MRLVCYERTFAKTFFIRVSWRLKRGEIVPRSFTSTRLLAKFLSAKISFTFSLIIHYIIFSADGTGWKGDFTSYTNDFIGRKRMVWGRLYEDLVGFRRTLLTLCCMFYVLFWDQSIVQPTTISAINSEISRTAKSISPLFWPSPRQAASCTSPRDIQDVFVNATHLASILGK